MSMAERLNREELEDSRFHVRQAMVHGNRVKASTFREAGLLAHIEAQEQELEMALDALRTAREAMGGRDEPFLDDGIRALRQELVESEAREAALLKVLEQAGVALSKIYAEALAVERDGRHRIIEESKAALDAIRKWREEN